MQIVQKYKIDLFKKLIEIWHNFGPLRAQNYIIYNWKFIFIVYIRMQMVQKYKIDLFKKMIEIWHDFWKSNFWKLRISMKYRIFDNIQFLKFWDLKFRISKIYIFWKFKIFEILIFEILIFEILDIWN